MLLPNFDCSKSQARYGDRTLTTDALAKLSEGIAPDIQLGEKLGISGTPFFVMNGEIFSGAVQLSDIEEILHRVQ